MRRNHLGRTSLFVLLTVMPAFGAATSSEVIEQYTATVSMLPEPIRISIERWTTTAERSALIEVIEKSDSKLTLDALEQQAKTGFVDLTDSLRYDLHYAVKFKAGDKHRLLLVCNRPMTLNEEIRTSGALQEAMTILDLTIASDGSGSGMALLGADALIDEATGGVQIITSGQAPVRLENVQLVE